jgi:hypothetical protein
MPPNMVGKFTRNKKIKELRHILEKERYYKKKNTISIEEK